MRNKSKTLLQTVERLRLTGCMDEAVLRVATLQANEIISHGESSMVVYLLGYYGDNAAVVRALQAEAAVLRSYHTRVAGQPTKENTDGIAKNLTKGSAGAVSAGRAGSNGDRGAVRCAANKAAPAPARAVPAKRSAVDSTRRAAVPARGRGIR